MPSRSRLARVSDHNGILPLRISAWVAMRVNVWPIWGAVGNSRSLGLACIFWLATAT